MPADALAELTRLQEQEERAVERMEERQRELATLQALMEDVKRRGEPPDAIEARIRAAEAEIERARQEAAARHRAVEAAERALPADLADENEG
jgi:hypothetical protein